MNETNRYVRPGEQVHVLVPLTIPTKPGSFSARGANLDRGRTVTLTAELIEANRDRFGKLAAWLDLLGDDDAQIARFGHVISRPGPWPEGDEVWIYGDPQWRMERDAARRNAWALTDERERNGALAEVERRFGPLPAETVSVRYRETPSEKAAKAQEADFAAARAAGTR